MKNTRLLEIETCKACFEYYGKYNPNVRTKGREFRCCKVNKLIKNISRNIPKWCSLPKAKDEDVIHNDWTTEDILTKAQDMKIKLSKDAARKILHNIDKNFDASIGINWDVIEGAILTNK